MKKNQVEFIYWFAFYNLDSPSVRYRAQYPLEFAQDQLGIKSKLIIPGYSFKKISHFVNAYFQVLLFTKKNSIIVIQRVHSNFIYANLLKLVVRLRKDITIYDLDDADYLEYNPKTIHWYAKRCGAISAGSNELVNYLKQFNQNVFHLTSPTVDLGIKKEEKNKVFTIGWIGGFGGGHKESMYELAFPAIKQLKFDCELHILGIFDEADEQELRAFFKQNEHVHLEIPRSINWLDEGEIQNKIKRFDLGVATLLNAPIQQAKSGIKAKQYMTNGVPVICNDLAENNAIVIDGFNGLIANSVEEFVEKITRLRDLPETAYMCISKNARSSLNNFNHHNYLATLTSAFH